MPMPKPSLGESHDDFVDRCMGDGRMNDDYPNSDQRMAVCQTQWDDMHKRSSDGIQHKNFTGIELKADKPGSFIARIATLNVIDKDGDVTLPGAFPHNKTILISAYQHGSWMGGLPVGKGIIQEQGNEVLVDGEFNMNSETGREHYETIKFAPELQEWSYGFRVKEYELDVEWQGNHVSRILKKLDVIEASPVLQGAGIGTATVTIKNEKNHGQTLANETELALAAIGGVIARVKSLADLRRGEGKASMSESTHDRMMRMMSQMGQMMHDMQEMMDEMEESPDDAEKALSVLILAKAKSELLEVM